MYITSCVIYLEPWELWYLGTKEAWRQVKATYIW